MRLTSNGIDFGSMDPASRLSFITLALTRSRCARDLNTIHENTTVSPRLSGIRGRGDSVVDRLIGCGPEIATDIRRTGRGPGALGHQEADPARRRGRVRRTDRMRSRPCRPLFSIIRPKA